MAEKTFTIKGDIVWSAGPTELAAVKDGYLVVVDGLVAGVFPELPAEYADIELVDKTGLLVMPGLVDAHVHAPQYAFRGTGLDLELLDWLNTYTFPEEAKYADLDYAERAYDIFVDDLKNSETCRAIVFGTLHVPATEMLMDKLEATGLKSYVGKVNMDRNGAPGLEEDTRQSLADTEQWLADTRDRYENTKPILTPRFTPSCTDELMEGIGKLKAAQNVPLQSHLSENLSEIDWVAELCPWASCYGDTYLQTGQLAGPAKSIMAHCVYSTTNEVEILKGTGCYIALCPESNADLASGIAPVRMYFDLGMNLALGSDVAGGPHLSMFSAIAHTVSLSKLRWRCVDESLKPITIPEAIYIATVGGGSFFGKVGTFEPGFEADILVLDDSGIRSTVDLDTQHRLERFCYEANAGGRVDAKFVAGRQIF